VRGADWARSLRALIQFTGVANPVRSWVSRRRSRLLVAFLLLYLPEVAASGYAVVGEGSNANAFGDSASCDHECMEARRQPRNSVRKRTGFLATAVYTKYGSRPGRNAVGPLGRPEARAGDAACRPSRSGPRKSAGIARPLRGGRSKHYSRRTRRSNAGGRAGVAGRAGQGDGEFPNLPASFAPDGIDTQHGHTKE